MTKFRFNEEYLSQIPALQLLGNLGYKIFVIKCLLSSSNSSHSSSLIRGISPEFGVATIFFGPKMIETLPFFCILKLR